MPRPLLSSIEPLEARIAPANLTVLHPLLDLMPSFGKTGTTIDLGAMFDSSPGAGYRTHVEFITNFDVNTAKPGLQAGRIVLELFDDKAPLTVQNFLSYIDNPNALGDFDGVYFHRFEEDLKTGVDFVLQTGGFEATDPFEHIEVGEPVHNEFNPNDPERSNKVGTVAMAKVGGDPNSATSEWFFNLNDNSGNLDQQNGGFTVFGNVTRGMDVVRAIAASPTVTLNGAEVPYQIGYNPDPDGNPATPPPTPLANQFISFTDVKVLTPKQSTIPNTAYSVVSVVDANGNPTDLVKTNADPATKRLSGDTLKLTYKQGASGVATVKVQVRDLSNPGAAPITEEFVVKLQPNLLVHAASDTLPLTAVAGDTGVAKIDLVNTGGGAANGKVDVKFYLSHIDGTDEEGKPLGPDVTGTILDASDIQVGSLTDAAVKIGSGKTGSLSARLLVPAGTSLTDGNYRLIAQVTPSTGNGAVIESYTDDNLMTDGGVHAFFTSPPAPNLHATGVLEGLPVLVIPGDTAVAKFGLSNTAGRTAGGTVTVGIYMSFDATPLTSTDTLDVSSDFLIGSVTRPLTLGAGKTGFISVPVAVPQQADIADGYYRVFGVLTSSSGTSSIVELTTSDNQATGNYHLLQRSFGTFAIENTLLGDVARKNAPFKYKNADGHLIALRMTGSGFGTVTTAESGGISVSLENTNLRSKFFVNAAAGVRPQLENVFVGASQLTPIGTLALQNVDWSGQVVAYGGARNMHLGNTVGDGDHFVGVGTSAAMKGVLPVVKLGRVQDLSFVSDVTLGSLSAIRWTDVNTASENVDVVGVKNFKVAGNFEADMEIAAARPSSTVTVNSFEVGGVLKNAQVKISANVGRVQLGAINGSELIVGAESVPTVLADFDLARSIGTLIVKGGVAGETAAIADSDIAAARFGKIFLGGTVDGKSGLDTFGIVADKIAFYKRGQGAPIQGADAGRVLDTSGHYQARVLG
jgi:peptidyl-prolyl cis-trans isomerase A (cyclophilin A)